MMEGSGGQGGRQLTKEDRDAGAPQTGYTDVRCREEIHPVGRRETAGHWKTGRRLPDRQDGSVIATYGKIQAVNGQREPSPSRPRRAGTFFLHPRSIIRRNTMRGQRSRRLFQARGAATEKETLTARLIEPADPRRCSSPAQERSTWDVHSAVHDIRPTIPTWWRASPHCRRAGPISARPIHGARSRAAEWLMKERRYMS